MSLTHKEIVFPDIVTEPDAAGPGWTGSAFILNPETGHYAFHKPPGLHKTVWENLREDWTEHVRRYESNPEDFYNSWHYLNGHPMYWRLKQDISAGKYPPNHSIRLEHGYAFGSDAINVMVMRVDAHGTHQDDDSLNVQTEIWLESGKWDLLPREELGVVMHAHTHDYDLDCGDRTYEGAVVKLARLVWEKYGNDRRIADDS